MKSLRYKLSFGFAAVSILAIGVSAAATGGGSRGNAADPAPAPVVASSEIAYEQVGATLTPPPDTFEPRVSGADAEKLALAGTEASVVSAVGGLYTNNQAVTEAGKLRFSNVAAWVVTLDGICSPYWGPHPESDGDCYYALRYVVVDAQTGAIIENFS